MTGGIVKHSLARVLVTSSIAALAATAACSGDDNSDAGTPLDAGRLEGTTGSGDSSVAQGADSSTDTSTGDDTSTGVDTGATSDAPADQATGDSASAGDAQDASDGSTQCVPTASVPCVTAITAGASHACALLADQTVRCWGANSHGELGLGTMGAPVPYPSAVPGVTGIVALEAGGANYAVGTNDWGSTCAARGGTNEVLCWGDNSFDKLGRGPDAGDVLPSAAPVLFSADAGAAMGVSGGNLHACALFGSEIDCWGADFFGSLGRGVGDAGPNSIGYPVQLGDAQPLQVASHTSAHVCARTQANTVLCWGVGRWGELGPDSGTAIANPTPVLIAGLPNQAVMELATTEYSTCARFANGEVWCWGWNYDGQTGHGTIDGGTVSPAFDPVPTKVTLPQSVLALGGGGGTMCSVLADHSVWCWGSNQLDVLGRGDDAGLDAGVTRSIDAAPVAGLTNIASVAVGGAFACALGLNGVVQCWGDNTSGELGRNTSTGTFATPAPLYWP
jgi:alpha-tubulin suppressor-like RCC1 family protein